MTRRLENTRQTMTYGSVCLQSEPTKQQKNFLRDSSAFRF